MPKPPPPRGPRGCCAQQRVAAPCHAHKPVCSTWGEAATRDTCTAREQAFMALRRKGAGCFEHEVPASVSNEVCHRAAAKFECKHDMRDCKCGAGGPAHAEKMGKETGPAQACKTCACEHTHYVGRGANNVALITARVKRANLEKGQWRRVLWGTHGPWRVRRGCRLPGTFQRAPSSVSQAADSRSCPLTCTPALTPRTWSSGACIHHHNAAALGRAG